MKTINLTKSYNNNTVLDNVNITINEGDIYGLVGENGAGKTSLFKILTGLSYKTSGNYIMLDNNQTTKNIGCIIENPMLYPHLSAYQNLEIEAIERGITNKALINETLKLVNLEVAENKKVANFSLGMKQRLALACALISKPKLLILDEPLNGLDPTGIIELRKLLIKLNKEHNITIVISSHILPELYEVATKYGFLHKGKLVKEVYKEEIESSSKESIYIKVDDLNRAKKILKEELNIKNIKIISNNEIEIYENRHEPSSINFIMFSNKVMVEEIYIKRNNLEKYFSKMIGGILGEEFNKVRNI